MGSQIFKSIIPNDRFYELINEICLKNEKYYIFNLESYKKGIYKEIIPKFIEYCKPFYHISKLKYLEKRITYNTFMTIMRQICNFNKIIYTSKIIYNKSIYTIEYYIYY
jgi:hypothetical protein